MPDTVVSGASGSSFLLQPGSAFVLLDDCRATRSEPRSRLYTEYVRTESCESTSGAEGLVSLMARLEEALREGLHAIVVLSYEDGAAMHGIPPRRDTGRQPSRVLLFRQLQRLSAEEVDAWLERAQDAHADAPNASASGIADIATDISEQAFIDAVTSIRRYIEAGDTYQVNFTYRLRFAAYGNPIALYRRLRARQPVPYGALIGFADGGTVLSLSPELFVRHRQGQLTAQPMKGTAAASPDATETARRAEMLAADAKNRAENVMIVDLLRNDLGQVAAKGSVTVPALFDVARYGRVLQMTSTVEAKVEENASLKDLLSALFPCGSITGAPKRRTMQIIRDLEVSPRGWYTGAIGWFEPPAPGRVIGDFCLSVPIRTLVLGQAQDGRSDAVRTGEMGVGSGIVHDSVAMDELAECRLKTRFLSDLPPEFSLFETMRVEQDPQRAGRPDEATCRFLDRHLQRLRASAISLGFPWSEDAARQALDLALAQRTPSPGGVWRLRLQLDPSGIFQAQTAPITPIETPVRILLASERTASGDFLLRHKTSRRGLYDRAWQAAEAQGAFDMLFRNEHDELTEGGRCNLFVRRNGRWITPPLEAGVLPGVMRSVLLDDPAWDAVEAPVSLADALHADELIVCNALRGVLPAVLVGG